MTETSVTLENITTPYGKLPIDVRMELFRAWLNGKAIEYQYRITANWCQTSRPEWSPDTVYRVRREEPIPHFIKWSEVNSKFVAMAEDADDDVFLFTIADITLAYGRWQNFTGIPMRQIRADVFTSFCRGNLPYQDSLVLRPVSA